MRAYKFRLYPSKTQQREMQTHLWFSKNLWNEMLELTKNMYDNFHKFPTRNTLQLISKDSGLFSQVAQNIGIRLTNSLKAKIRCKKGGKVCGFPRFKSIDRMKSLHYLQHGFSLNKKKVNISPFGMVDIEKHREIIGNIKTLTLKREATGKWFAIFTAEEEPSPARENNGSRVGIDLGLTNFAVLSDGTTIKNPRHLKIYEERLAKKQISLSKKTKGSGKRKVAKKKVAILHEKVKNTRKDFLHKTSHKLVHSHSFIALEDLGSAQMAEQQYGKHINDAGWSGFANMISYKADLVTVK